MPLHQTIENAREERIGKEGVAAAAFTDALKRSAEALAWLRAQHADAALRLLQLPALKDDLAGIGETAGRLRKGATDIVVLGVGGSSLGGQTLSQLAGHAVPGVGALRAAPHLHFMDNLDPDTFGELLTLLPLPTTRFIAISKSG